MVIWEQFASFLLNPSGWYRSIL